MKTVDKLIGEKLNLRLIQTEDKELYFATGFENVDKDVEYYTGSTGSYTRELIDVYIDRIVADETRYDFLILDKSDQLLGEVVLKDIDKETRIGGFRICLFSSQEFGRGVGTEATQMAVKFAFEELNLHRLELEVYSYNPRAKRVYEKVGFVEEGVKRDAMFINGEYHDVVIMGMLESDRRGK